MFGADLADRADGADLNLGSRNHVAVHIYRGHVDEFRVNDNVTRLPRVAQSGRRKGKGWRHRGERHYQKCAFGEKLYSFPRLFRLTFPSLPRFCHHLAIFGPPWQLGSPRKPHPNRKFDLTSLDARTGHLSTAHSITSSARDEE